jgi:hypothetical protein
VTAWLRRGAAAASVASDRSDLWPAASLAWLAYLGWLPFLLAVAPPQAHDVAQLAVRLYSSSAYPANVIALAVAAVGGFILLCLLVALGEVAVWRSLRPAREPGPEPGADAEPDASHAILSGLTVLLLACVPVALAVAWLLIGAVANAPTVYTAPGGEATVAGRLAATVVPQLALLGVAMLLAQAVGGRLLRAAIAAAPDRLGSSLRAAFSELAARPARWIGLAAVGWLKDALLLLASWALLRVLWNAIVDNLAPGLPGGPQALLLLLGFVAIWLVLLLAGGALHAFVSAWWLLEEGEGR